jgi:hypothetical protein
MADINRMDDNNMSVTAAKTQDLAGLAPEALASLRMKNQWKMNLQNNMADILRDVSSVDDKKADQVDPRDFMRILETRLRSSENQKACKEQLVDYVLNFQDQDSGLICYKEMAEDLSRFDYSKETNQGFVRGTKSQASISSG